MKYKKDAAPLRFASPSTVLAVLGALVALLGGVILVVGLALHQNGAALGYYISMSALVVLGVGAFLLFLAGALTLVLPPEDHIRFMVLRALCLPEYGNPLHLKDGENLPPVACTTWIKMRIRDRAVGAGGKKTNPLSGE